MNYPHQSRRRMLKIREVQHQTGLGRSALYSAISQGTFPAGVKIGARSVAWDSMAIEAWVNDRIAEAGNASI